MSFKGFCLSRSLITIFRRCDGGIAEGDDLRAGLKALDACGTSTLLFENPVDYENGENQDDYY